LRNWDHSQIKMTGIAQKDRKKTACPAGTRTAALIIAVMMTKIVTAPIIKRMPRVGFIL
jgi:hypothetical protein